ncbi:hypothetical protein BH11BAC7_BH11BAC7_35710 [soil metagenome]
MKVTIHFLNGNDDSTQNHYLEKEYRNDVIIEINNRFYEVYFFVAESMQYEMTKGGFFALPGLIVLDEITNEKIYNSINYLIDIRYFESFKGYDNIPYKDSFVNKWYVNTMSQFKPEAQSSYVLRTND